MMAATKKATRHATRKAPSRSAATTQSHAKAAAPTDGPVGNLVVATKVKEAVKADDIRMSADFPDASSAEVQHLIHRAIQRARDNGRGTVRPSDR